MSIEEILGLSNRRRHRGDGLADQVEHLQHELERLSRRLTRRGGEAADDFGHLASDFGRTAAHQAEVLARGAGRQARRGAIAVSRDPLPVIAIVGTGLLLARLLSRR